MILFLETVNTLCILSVGFILSDSTKNANLRKGLVGFIIVVVLMSTLIYKYAAQEV